MFVETSGPNIYQCLREGVSGGNLVSLRFFFLFFLWNREDPDANRTASEAPPAPEERLWRSQQRLIAAFLLSLDQTQELKAKRKKHS